MKTLLTATALVLSMTAVSDAATDIPKSDVLAGGPIYVSAQNFAYCEFVNMGTTAITLTSIQFFENGSTTAIASNQICSGAIAPNATCFAYPTATIAGFLLSCKVTFSAPATSVRGALQLYDSNANSLATVELR